MVLSSSGTFTLAGILKGGGLDCRKLFDVGVGDTDGSGSEDLEDETETGVWMRISSFEGWISGLIADKTKVGRNLRGEMFAFLALNISVDGSWGEWESWSNCSKSCGGSQYRVRVCNRPRPQNGGQNCTGIEEGFQTRDCNNCPGKNKVLHNLL